MPHTASGSWTRLSVSMLPPEVEPEEREFVRLLERALAPSYTLVKRLGAGGMGAVYLARDPVLKRLVAVKLLAPSLAADLEARARFEREARAVASISHPSVVAVYSVGSLENGVPYFVMQYVHGLTLAERIQRDGPLDAPTAERVLGELASALAAAHRKGVIHRDLKPSNVIWDDESGRVMLTDFGIAAVRETGEPVIDQEKLTQTGAVMGTPAYMSPEQLLAEEVTDRTDIYALGLLGYEMLLGKGPYEVSSPREVLAAHLRDQPSRISSVRADVEAELERLLEQCLSKDPQARPSAREVEDRLLHGATVLLEWPPPGLERLREKFRGVLKALALGSTMLGVPLVASTVFDRNSAVRDILPRPEFLLSLSILGLVAFLAGCVRLARFFRRLGRAVDGGYRWGTIMEVTADARGDTGALITGAREYATLTPAGRSTLRLQRVLRAWLLLVASIIPVLGYMVSVLVAARFDAGPTIVLWSSLLLAGLLVAAFGALDVYENRLLKPARMRKTPLASVEERPAELAQSWTNTFDQVRRGQRLGAGPTGYRKRVVRIALEVAGFAAAGAILANLLFATTTVMSVLGEASMPDFGVLKERVERVRRLERYRVAPDSTITPLRAGQALHSIARAGGRVSSSQYEAPPALDVPGFVRPQGRYPYSDSGTIADAFRQARSGFTDAQRRWIRAYSENPALREFRLAANAPALDLAAAAWQLDSVGTIPYYMLPGPGMHQVREAARSNIAAAALELNAGQTRDADRRLRETLSIGFLLIDHGRTFLEVLQGAALVNEARVAMEAFYQATGRPGEGRFVSAASDPLLDAPTAARPRSRLPMKSVFDSVRAVVRDSTIPLGYRWEMVLGYSALEPCTDLRQLVFGPDSSHRAMLRDVREHLIRYPSDSLRYAIATRALDASDPLVEGFPRSRSSSWTLRTISFLTGHRVFEACGITAGL